MPPRSNRQPQPRPPRGRGTRGRGNAPLAAAPAAENFDEALAAVSSSSDDEALAAPAQVAAAPQADAAPRNAVPAQDAIISDAALRAMTSQEAAPPVRSPETRLQPPAAHAARVMLWRAALPAPAMTQSEASKGNAKDMMFYFKVVTAPPDVNLEPVVICIVCENAHKKAAAEALEKNVDLKTLWSCHNYIYGPSTSNSTLRIHLDAYHREEYTRFAAVGRWSNLLPSYKEQARAAQEDADTAQNYPVVEYSREEFHRRLVNWVVVDDQALLVVEKPELRLLFRLLNPDLTDEDIPRRNQLRALILRQWQRSFEQLKTQLKLSLGQISFTTDGWDTLARRAFVGVTCHWMARGRIPTDVVLKSAVIGFRRLEGSHTGQNLANAVFFVLNRAEVLPKLGRFTTDAASNNKTMMSELKRLITAVPHARQDWHAVRDHVYCLSHGVNVSQQTMIVFLGIQPPGDDGVLPERGDAEKKTAVNKTRDVCRAVRASPKRRDSWETSIAVHNAAAAVKNAALGEHLPKVDTFNADQQLVLDVKHRWDSTYVMIIRFLSMQDVYKIFLEQNVDFAQIYPPMSAEEILTLNETGLVLMAGHIMQLALAGHTKPLLAEVIPQFEIFMTNMEAIAVDKPHLADVVKAGMDLAIKYYNRTDLSDSYILCMFVHPKYKLAHIHQNWEPRWINHAIDIVKHKMRDYVARRHPQAAAAPAAPAARQAAGPSQPHRPQNLREMYAAADRLFVRNLDDNQPVARGGGNTIDQIVEAEYNSWLDRGTGLELEDVCAYWSLPAAQAQWPTIFNIAMDYLPTQATSVPCERVFSSAGETDTTRRSRLSPDLMEALQMLKYMIRESRLSFTDHLSSFEWVQDMLVKQARAELGQDADFNTFEELLNLV